MNLMERLEQAKGVCLTPMMNGDGEMILGVAYNLTKRGRVAFEDVIERKLGPDPRVTREEALQVLDADLMRIEQVLLAYFAEFGLLDDVRSEALVETTFGMGTDAIHFKRMIDGAKVHDWTRVAKELYRSRLPAADAERLAHMILTGQER